MIRRGTPGQWNAYVGAGVNKAEQLQRLNEVPKEYRNDVIRHMRTVVALKEAKKRG